MPDLPACMHLFAKAPVIHPVRGLVAVLAPQVAPARALLHVAVLNQSRSHFRAARAEIHPQERLATCLPAPGDEFVGAKLVGFERVPGAVEDTRPVLIRSHSVKPVIAGNEIAARVADDGYAQLPDFVYHVVAESVGVPELGSRLVDPGVDRPSEMLQKRAEKPAVQFRNLPGGINHNASRGGRSLRPRHPTEPGVRCRRCESRGPRPLQESSSGNFGHRMQLLLFGFDPRTRRVVKRLSPESPLVPRIRDSLQQTFGSLAPPGERYVPGPGRISQEVWN